MSFINNAIKISKDGVSVTSSGTSQAVAIPTNLAGTTARVVRVSCPNSSHYGYVLPGPSTAVATTASVAIGNFSDILLDVTGCTHIAYLQGAAGAVINISPVEV